MLQRGAKHERLRQDWMVKGTVGIADRVDLAVEVTMRDAEQRRIGLAELGDVIGRAGRPDDAATRACSSAR